MSGFESTMTLAEIAEWEEKARDGRLRAEIDRFMDHPGLAIPAETRFWEKVDKSGDCWNWTATLDHKGYGQFAPSHKMRQAHRFAYELSVAPIPEGLVLDHLCRNRACVNPAHLEPVTTRENSLRGDGFAAKNAAKTHCIRGHEFTPTNTCYSKNGGRSCRICRNAANRRSHLLHPERSH